MYNHLSKKEKQKKLAQARKRAVLWSIQEQRCKTLKTTKSLERLSTSTTLHSPTQEVEIFYPALTEPQTTARALQASDSTVAALTATISDLQEQRRQLDITIQVLTRRLNDILSSKPPSSRR